MRQLTERHRPDPAKHSVESEALETLDGVSRDCRPGQAGGETAGWDRMSGVYGAAGRVCQDGYPFLTDHIPRGPGNLIPGGARLPSGQLLFLHLRQERR